MGGFCPGGFCPGGFVLGGDFVRGGFVRGDFVLEPSRGGLNYLSRWFISLKFEDKKTLGLKTNLTTVFIGGREGS